MRILFNETDRLKRELGRVERRDSITKCRFAGNLAQADFARRQVIHARFHSQFAGLDCLANHRR